jgi:GAF domain-containing protein/CheY-like chemotaxis protein
VDDNRNFCDAIQEELSSEAVITAVTTVNDAVAAVARAQSPFDVFIIDQKLRGEKVDGIQLMANLLRTSPESAAIVLTGFASREDGLRALQAGAYRYIPKSADWPTLFQELKLLMGWLVTSRKKRREMEWLRILTEIGQQFQFCLRREDVAEAIIAGAVRLGFKQARLWQVFVEDRRIWLKGWKQLPAKHLPGFEDFRMQADNSPYTRHTVHDREVRKYNGRERGPSPLDLLYPDPAAPAKEGEWLDVPLWDENRCLAKLSLYHYDQTRPLDQAALSVVQLYANQAATAFYRAELFEQITISRQFTLINERPTPRSDREFDELLEFIYCQVSQVLNASNFYICLIDWDARQMDFRLKYHAGQKIQPTRHPLERRNGLAAFVAFEKKTVRLSHGTKRFRQRHKLLRFDREGPRSWLGVPMIREGKVLGVLVAQDYAHNLAYTQADQRLLEAVAEQAAVAIDNAYLSMQAHRSAQQLEMLQYVSSEILKLAPADLDQMLHIVLTAVTASYGLGLNRAMLFLVDDDQRELYGRLGIGYFRERDARRAWEKDVQSGMNFQTYLARLQTHKLEPTPLETIVPKLHLSLKDPSSVFSVVVNSGKQQLFTMRKHARRIPSEFRQAVLLERELALIPLKAGDKVIGVLVVDNKFNRRPIADETLTRLQTFVNQAALALENARVHHAELSRQDREREALSQIQQAIIDFGADADMANVLGPVIVQQAIKALWEVDAITLYYFDRATNTLQLGGIAGVQDETTVRIGPPRAGSVVRRILELDEPRFVANAQEDEFLRGAFVKREGIHSAAAFPLKYGDERVGCMFFNYRQPHEFNRSEKHNLTLFAQEAALAIHKAVLYDEAVRLRQRFETVARITPVINATLDPEEVVRSILSETLKVVPQACEACMLYYDPETNDLIFSPMSFEFYHIDVVSERDRSRVHAHEESIVGLVANARKSMNVLDVRTNPYYLMSVSTTQSELCVPIMARDELLGVLVLESDSANAFTDDDQRLVEALADQAAVILKKAQEHRELLKTQDALAANSAIAWMGLFGSNWSHTVNQRTYEIDGKVYLLRQAMTPPTSQTEKWLDEILEATRQLKALPGRFSPEPHPGKHTVQIDYLVRNCISYWCDETKHPNISLQLELNCGDTRVPIEESWLEIALEKLINNALKAMPGKGQLTVRSARHGGQIEVLVQDTGKGIPPEVVDKYILKKPMPRTTPKEGSGLGLLIALKVLEAHGGDLKLFRTALGEGTTFMFHLPVAETAGEGA